MKEIIKIGTLILFFALISSCEKEEVLTDSGKIEKELKSIINEYDITKCYIYSFNNGSNVNLYSNVEFFVDGGFIVVENRVDLYSVKYERLNLTYLVKYQYYSNSKTINFYFSNVYPN